MAHLMEKLLELQELQLGGKAHTKKNQAQIQKLREDVPAPILGHFDRLIARGKKGVAVCRNGVCSACHLRFSTGAFAHLAHSEEIHLCDNCGRYIYLPADESAPPPPQPPARRRKKTTEK